MSNAYFQDKELLLRESEDVVKTTIMLIKSEIKSLMLENEISNKELAVSVKRTPQAGRMFLRKLEKLDTGVTLGPIAMYLYSALKASGKEVECVKIPVNTMLLCRDFPKQVTVPEMVELRKTTYRKYLFAEALQYGYTGKTAHLRILEDVAWKKRPYGSSLMTYVKYALLLGVTHIVVPLETIEDIINDDYYALCGGSATKKKKREEKKD